MSDDESARSDETMYASDSESELCELERLCYQAEQKKLADEYEDAQSRLRLSMTCRELVERAAVPHEQGSKGTRGSAPP